MFSELETTVVKELPVVKEIQGHLDRLTASPTPATMQQFLQLILNIEPEVMPIVSALFGSNPIVSAVTTLLPTLLPILQNLANALAAIPSAEKL